MDNPLIVALAITIVGMGLLFLALAFFYGLLSLISSALPEGVRPAATTEIADQVAPDRATPPARAERLLQAAAIAVALARAEAEGRPAAMPESAGLDAEPLSPWSSLHQGRRMAAGSSPWRTL